MGAGNNRVRRFQGIKKQGLRPVPARVRAAALLYYIIYLYLYYIILLLYLYIILLLYSGRRPV